MPQSPVFSEKAVHFRTYRGFLGPVTALFVSLSAISNEMTLSDITAALFSSPGLMGAAIARKETRFAGYLLTLAAIFIRLSVPIANILLMLYNYYTL